MRRRAFVHAMALPLLRPLGGTVLRPGEPLKRIGLQLYTVRDLMRADVARTLEQVADAGYREVEFAGYFDQTPARIRKLLDSQGLTSPSSHLPLADLQQHLDRTLELAETIGHRYLVVPSLDEKDRRTLDDYRRVAAALNRAGEAAWKRGLRVGYHNHDFEFDRIDGVLPYDVLLQRTDPALVFFEMDFFWITRGRADPFAYFERHAGRFHLCHIKDMDRRGEMTVVGTGRIDFAALLRRREQAGLRHFFVEHDNPPEPIAFIRASHAYLRKLDV
jgi:sugar phosphate isomerase/epimerase